MVLVVESDLIVADSDEPRIVVERHTPPFGGAALVDLAWELGVSRATAYHLIDLYKTFGTVDALQPHSRGRKAGVRLLPNETEQIIAETIRDVYLKPADPL
jgi:hypothetical protein